LTTNERAAGAVVANLWKKDPRKATEKQGQKHYVVRDEEEAN
jgi:hypothetical protein